ncbi:chromatin-remodeling complex ATPase chain Iswi-like [Contarinia nasturtii]|uniref:chromatin-remodeling complex ATPase chain Iswi-like n=1 Tax=Contarinia nasturtii TaxID=265458 RepID=UPI0012D4C0BC|nr:chromatin-remodeling complex ATPase chain Iswi-like [Contarinia nasturtii]
MAEAMEVDDTKIGDENSNSKIVDVSPKESFLSPKQQKRLDYLLAQAEIFTHFVGNSPKQAAKQKMALIREKKLPSTNRRRNKGNDEESDIEDDETTTGIRFDTTPTWIKGEMRDYQLRGLNWMIALYEQGVNGILADEMGLGKTLQTISVLGYLKHCRSINGAFLVIGPKSTLRNWYNEVNRFCPSLRALILIGDKEERDKVVREMDDRMSWDCLLTTYEMILSEKSRLKRVHWRYLVVDEAHRLKNENSKLSTILRTFHSDNRLLLTGTPLQNNLHELWALLNFLLPDVFASSADFDTWFDSDDCLRGNNEIVNRLRAILKPFMLRRIKAEVEKSLLPKIEVKLFVGLTPLQRETYKKVLLKEVKKIDAFGDESTKSISNILMELRKASNHPYLIDGVELGPPYTTDMHLVTSCGKMMVLDKLLAKLKAQGSRVVMFSQFVIMLDILEDYLTWRGHEFRRLDGNTPYEDRATNIDEFNAENSNIFLYLISTRAGGLGINLATADTVIIYDSDWNPQPDFQAIDRVHRIGQKKQVRVFRLVSENTVDERIVQRAEIKSRLDKMVIQQGRTVDKRISEITKGMKRDMIRFGAEQILSSSDGSNVIDIDIDKILKRGEEKTAEENAKYAEMGESELTTLTLEEASSTSIYQYEGTDFRTKQKRGADDTYELRKRKQYNFPMMPSSPIPVPAIPRNMKLLHDFHFYPKELYEMCESDGRINMAIDRETKESLMSKGFVNWSRNDLKLYVDAMAECGRDNLTDIFEKGLIPGKTLNELTQYHLVFWQRGKTEIKTFDRCIKPLVKKEMAEKLIEHSIEAFEWKMTSYRCIEVELTIKGMRKSNYTREHDTFILMSLQKHGIHNPNVYSLMRREISLSKRYCFDWYLRSRTEAELQKRSHALLQLIIAEYTEHMAKNTSAASDTAVQAGNSTHNAKKGSSQQKTKLNMTAFT